MFNVYLICAEVEENKLYKIGYTRRSINQRIKEFKTGNASDFYIVDSFKSKWGTKIESRLHNLFRSKKISGEWFDLNDEDIKTFKDMCNKIHENLETISKHNTYYLDKGDFY